MKVKELKKLLGFLNREAEVKIDGKDIIVSYSCDEAGKWTINLTLESPNSMNNTCGENYRVEHKPNK